jgi:hypothetical protein
VALTFGANSSVGPLDYGVVVRDKNTWLQLYTVPPAKVFGGLVFSLPNNVTLPNGGAFLELVTGTGTVVSSVEYNDVGRWPTIADGGGPSLELRCPTATRAIRTIGLPRLLPRTPIAIKETTGTPGLVNTVVVCPAAQVSSSRRCTSPRFSTIRSAVRAFAMPPSSSRSTTPVLCRSTSATGASSPRAVCCASPWPRPIARWTPGQVAVFVGDLAGFNAKWASVVPASAMVVSAFEGELANGGDKLVMMDDNGFEVDAVVYNDKFPWPLVADGLGADNTYIELVGDPLPQADWSGQTYAET